MKLKKRLVSSVYILSWLTCSLYGFYWAFIALKSRMLYLSSVFLISQIGDFFENDKYKYIWLFITLLLFIFGTIVHYKFDRKY